jgi:FtsH-binding integral membrane protein
MSAPQPADPARPLGIVRSVGAVFFGMIVVIVLSIGTDALLRTIGVFPRGGQRMSDAQFVIATVYRIVFGIIGGFVTAVLAPARPMQHALFYGFVGFGLSCVGYLGSRNLNLGPSWYPIALIVTSIPCAWVGGLLLVGRRQPATQPPQ